MYVYEKLVVSSTYGSRISELLPLLTMSMMGVVVRARHNLPAKKGGGHAAATAHDLISERAKLLGSLLLSAIS